MPDIRVAFEALERANAGSNIAGYVDKGNFLYEVSKSVHIPAAALLFDAFEAFKSPDIYTNLPGDHWIFTYTKPGGRNPTGLRQISAAPRLDVLNSVPAGKRQIKLVAGEGEAGPLGSAGGLYGAAKSLEGKHVFYKGGEKIDTKEKGLHRALRYYMLAAYAVLGKCAKADYEGGNYVCAMAVSDTGQIISWGVNSRSFHHGEVNMLLNYFGGNATAAQLPPKTIVFSTLTPCEQCSTFLQTVRPTDSIILMGQKDTGDFGKAGEAHGLYLRDLTDPVRARMEEGTKLEWQETDTVPKPTPKNPLATTKVTRTEKLVVSAMTRFNIDTELSHLVTDGNIATKIGKSCKQELRLSYDSLARKFTKPRVDNVAEESVKMAVLNYLQNWMKNVGSDIKIRNIG